MYGLLLICMPSRVLRTIFFFAFGSLNDWMINQKKKIADPSIPISMKILFTDFQFWIFLFKNWRKKTIAFYHLKCIYFNIRFIYYKRSIWICIYLFFYFLWFSSATFVDGVTRLKWRQNQSESIGFFVQFVYWIECEWKREKLNASCIKLIIDIWRPLILCYHLNCFCYKKILKNLFKERKKRKN